jgi:hypothetical protein
MGVKNTISTMTRQ